MISINVVEYTDNISKEIAKFEKKVKQLKKDAIVEYKSLTPIRTGNARRHTTLQGDTIEANYPYAERLDDGYSKQAPQGMTKPFEKWIDKEVTKIFKD